MIILILSTVVFIVYSLWALLINKGWNLFVNSAEIEPATQSTISIVIPFRNEAEHLADLLDSLAGLNYSHEFYEVILVNDDSEDFSVDIINKWQEKNGLALKIIDSDGQGKKIAQLKGVKYSKHDLIACTDADCRVAPEWLNRINQTFYDSRIKLAFGSVLIEGENHRFQQLEFLSLIGSTMAMLKLGWLVMGNAANMAFRKEVYLQVQSKLADVNSPSGDDIFLLHEVGKTKEAVGVMATKGEFVKTAAQSSITKLFNQRIRWASKAKKYHSKPSIAVAILIFSVNALLLALLIVSFIDEGMSYYFLLFFILKTLIDYFLLKNFAKYYNQPYSLAVTLGQELINLIYIPVVGLLSQLISFKWKGRKY